MESFSGFYEEVFWASAVVSGNIVTMAKKPLSQRQSIKIKSIFSKLFESEIFPAGTAVPIDVENCSAMV